MDVAQAAASAADARQSRAALSGKEKDFRGQHRCRFVGDGDTRDKAAVAAIGEALATIARDKSDSSLVVNIRRQHDAKSASECGRASGLIHCVFEFGIA